MFDIPGWILVIVVGIAIFLAILWVMDIGQDFMDRVHRKRRTQQPTLFDAEKHGRRRDDRKKDGVTVVGLVVCAAWFVFGFLVGRAVCG